MFSRSVSASVVILVLAVVPPVESAKVKVSTLAKCPAWGAEERGTTRAALNEVKHRVPSGTVAIPIDLADIGALQDQADTLVKSGVNARVLPKDRAKLRDLSSGSKHFSEGDLAGIVGFVVGKATANVGESANCYLHGPSNNDFELSIAERAMATPYDAIVAEMIPQGRPAGWTLARLRTLAADHRDVQVVGQLMFDTRHLPNPKSGTNHESPRVSTWEIHPVTRFLVCRRGTGRDPAHDVEWQTLEDLGEG